MCSCVHFFLLSNWRAVAGKMVVAAEILRRVKEKGDKIVVVSNYTSVRIICICFFVPPLYCTERTLNDRELIDI